MWNAPVWGWHVLDSTAETASSTCTAKNWILPSFLPKIQYFEKNELVSNNENMWYDMESQPNLVKIWDTEKRAFCLLAPKGVLIGVESSKSCFYCCHLLATFQICYELPVWVHKWVWKVRSKFYASIDSNPDSQFPWTDQNHPKSHTSEKSDRPGANIMLATSHVDAADLWALMRTRPDTRLHSRQSYESIDTAIAATAEAPCTLCRCTKS